MIKPLTAALATLALALPAGATPVTFDYVQDSLMVEVPTFGPSRYETVAFCLNEAGVQWYQDLVTDDQNELFEGCMHEHT